MQYYREWLERKGLQHLQQGSLSRIKNKGDGSPLFFCVKCKTLLTFMKLLYVYILPGAAKDELMGEYNGRLKIRLQAPAIDGKANKALIKFLAKHYGCRKNQLKIISGEKSRMKTLELPDGVQPLIK